MNAILKHLFTHLRTNVPDAVTIARWNNQLSAIGQKQGYIIGTPAIYIQLGDHQTGDSPLGGYRKEGPMTITVWCVSDSMADIDDEAYVNEPAGVDPFEDMKFCNDVANALDYHGWQQPNNEGGAYSFTSLQQQTHTTDDDFDDLRVDILTYLTDVVDCSAYLKELGKYEETTLADPGLDLEVQPFTPEEEE